MKEIEIPFGAKDSELKGWEYTIPEGMEAEIKDGKIVVREKESEDERIRKKLIQLVNKESGWQQEFPSQCQCLAWLEKQKEQKPVDYEAELKKCKDNPLYFFDKYVSIKIKQKPAEWSEEDEKLIDDVMNSLCCYQNTLSDYQKEIVGEEIRKLKSLKPQPKQEWSEEDEEMRLEAIRVLVSGCERYRKESGCLPGWHKVIDWLKSLRPQPHWKPSEEQIKAIESCFCEFGEGCPDEDGLRSLYNDLKKLI